MITIRSMFITSATIATVACGPTDVGNPIDVDFALYNTRNASSSRLDSTNGFRGGPGDITIQEAWIAVERVRLRDAVNCNGNAEVDLIGPYAVDMLAPGTLPALTDIEMPESSYCRFEIRWERYDAPLPDGAPGALQNASIVLRGSRSDGVLFTIRGEREDEYRLDAVDGAFSIDLATNGLFMGFDSEVLLSGIDLDAAEIGPDGEILIDQTSNDELADIFDDNLQIAAKLFNDDDGDGLLDADEQEPDDVLAE